MFVWCTGADHDEDESTHRERAIEAPEPRPGASRGPYAEPVSDDEPSASTSKDLMGQPDNTIENEDVLESGEAVLENGAEVA